MESGTNSCEIRTIFLRIRTKFTVSDSCEACVGLSVNFAEFRPDSTKHHPICRTMRLVKTLNLDTSIAPPFWRR